MQQMLPEKRKEERILPLQVIFYRKDISKNKSKQGTVNWVIFYSCSCILWGRSTSQTITKK